MYNDIHVTNCVSRLRTYNPSSTWIHCPFHTPMREARHKTAYDIDERERARREQETAEQSVSHTDEGGVSQARCEQGEEHHRTRRRRER